MSKKKKKVEYDLFADFGAVDAENIVAGAVIKAAEDARNQEPTKIATNRRLRGKNRCLNCKIIHHKQNFSSLAITELKNE